MNIIVQQRAVKCGNFLGQFNFKIKAYANVGCEKYPEDAPIEVTNHHIPSEIFNN